MIENQTELKCSECYRKWCPYRNTIMEECRFVDKKISEELSKKITIEIVKQIKEEQK